MIAQAVNLINFLKGPKQFIIPIYQRTYSNPVFNSLEFERFKSQTGLNRFKWLAGRGKTDKGVMIRRIVPKVISINVRNVVSEVY